ncbi:MAG: ABC transporter permease [Propionibacteriaceae bacterium]|jgi:putative ABC transport system permease protein|nr:ABC transporter permease [Propionibacteriaceae bacterium]
MLSAIDQGLIYALLALGVFLTFRILNFADLTVDASFTTGAGTAATLISHGYSPWLGVVAGLAAGSLGGLVTALLHTKFKIDPLLASILTMLGLYSVNLRIMGRANTPLLNVETVFTPLRDHNLIGTWTSVAILAAIALAVKFAIDWFLSTNFGLAVMATGDNPAMASSLGVSTDVTKIVTLMLANGLVGLAGAVMAQYQGFADIGGGTGLILVGLASVILGNAVLGTRFMVLATLGVVVGSVLYRLVIYFALLWDFVKAQDMKLISAVLVVAALVLSQSKALRGAFSRLSPWRADKDAPEPMTVVPNRFSPLAETDAVSFSPDAADGLEDGTARETDRRTRGASSPPAAPVQRSAAAVTSSAGHLEGRAAEAAGTAAKPAGEPAPGAGQAVDDTEEAI